MRQTLETEPDKEVTVAQSEIVPELRALGEGSVDSVDAKDAPAKR